MLDSSIREMVVFFLSPTLLQLLPLLSSIIWMIKYKFIASIVLSTISPISKVVKAMMQMSPSISYHKKKSWK